MTIALESREESRRETGTSLMFIGLAIWVADALVAFFFPAAVKIGRQGTFLSVILVLAICGYGADGERMHVPGQARGVSGGR